MRLLDLCCGAGGASVGYARAGFDVVGVDLAAQPRYPFEFHRADALAFPLDGFDVIHASPPCQRWAARGRVRSTHPDLVTPLRARLVGRRYVIENIPAAPLVSPLLLCGRMFGLGVFRHRCFESSELLLGPAHHPHAEHQIGKDGLYTVTGHSGGHGVKKSGSRKVDGGSVAQWRVAMGIDWMIGAELVEAIPPAYTTYIGVQLLRQLGI